MIKIAVIPIDNRPICYDIIKDILSIDESIELFMPKLDFLGGLTTNSNIDEIFNFIETLKPVDYLITALDTIAYGGLVSSRRCPEDLEEIKNRIEKFKKLARKKARKILAFSSIMRISNNNINEEEKEYWSQFGKRIFDWSYYLHKSEVQSIANCVINKVPDYILQDYLATRKRNFEINKLYLNWAQEGFFDTLIFSKDDCAEYGLNVKEAQELNNMIKQKNITCAQIKTGADEIPLSLLCRAINDNVKINPVFVQDEFKNLISKYEDIPIKDCTKAQIELAGSIIDDKNPDLNLIINNFKFEQGDLVLGDIINNIDKKIEFTDNNFFIADVNNANGSDVELVNQLFQDKKSAFFGYCAYNTSANTLGCAIFCAVVKFLAEKKGTYNDTAFKKIQFIRFLDDCYYQAVHRKFVRNNEPDFSDALKKIELKLNQDAKLISQFLDFYPEKIEYSLPWDRSFEIRIKIN